MTATVEHTAAAALSTSEELPTLAELEADPRYARGIPLRTVKGTIRAFAMVDAEDFARFGHLKWHLAARGRYVMRSVREGGKRIREVSLHREVLGITDPAVEVDHRGRNPLDNRRLNLRVTRHDGNTQNVPARGGASPFRGVSQWPSGTWFGQVGLDGHNHYLGTYQTELEAALVAELFRRNHMPFALPDPVLVDELARHGDAARLAVENGGNDERGRQR